jgi:hypothetical protein
VGEIGFANYKPESMRGNTAQAIRGSRQRLPGVTKDQAPQRLKDQSSRLPVA